MKKSIEATYLKRLGVWLTADTIYDNRFLTKRNLQLRNIYFNYVDTYASFWTHFKRCCYPLSLSVQVYSEATAINKGFTFLWHYSVAVNDGVL